MNVRIFRALCSALIGSMALSSFPVLASDKVTCESRNGRYTFCRADTGGNVELSRELSRDRCREGRSWGYEDRGVWVDRGCSAEFSVGRDKRHDKRAAIAAGVVGLAVIAAIAANANNQQEAQDEFPQDGRRWNVGEFSAFDDITQTMIAINVQRDGSVSAYTQGVTVSGNFRGDRLSIGNTVYRIERTAEGFQAVDESNRSIRLQFNRQGYRR